MGREVRRVPKSWRHPKNRSGAYIPLFDGFLERAKEWDRNNKQWERGFYRFSDDEPWQAKTSEMKGCFAEWDGGRPARKHYMPDWPLIQRSHYQMYETCTEGTPISPVFATPEALARWLADNEASSMGNQTTSYDQWLNMIVGKGSSVAMLLDGGKVVSGVEAGV